jgi:hypothetical protein
LDVSTLEIDTFMLPLNIRIQVPLYTACVPEVTISKLLVCNRVEKNLLDAQLILSIFRHLKRIISTNCFIHKVVPPDDGTRYAGNM